MKALYGRKLGMTRVFDDTGEHIPVTVLEVGPNIVFDVKTKERNGYRAVQLGFGSQKPQRVNRPLSGHYAKAKQGTPRFIGELRLDKQGFEDDTEYEVGNSISVADVFSVGARVDVRGVSKGKGFAGVFKRHHMSGQPRTHGTHEVFRHVGSIGNRKFPGRVFKNKRMPGHMGVERVLQEGLEVVAIREEDNALLVRGSVPGAKNGIVFVRNSMKRGAQG